jgi:GNAT superfamily N-acetyltransferase
MGTVHKGRLRTATLSGLRFRVSHAGLDDLDLLVTHRLNMWRDIHPELGMKVDESEGLTRKWIREKLSKGVLVGFIAKTEDDRVAGSGCIWIREEQPRPTNPRQAQPYLMSMYTERKFRRKGVAKLIVRRAIDWCRERDYERVILHASEEGRALYESFGFEPTTEMRLKF